MSRLVYFLMAGLVVTVLQVSTVAAQMGDPNMAPPTGTSGMPPMTPPAGDISHCAQFSGPPKAACEAAAAGK